MPKRSRFNEIIHAAAVAFNEKGYNGASMRYIAKKLGLLEGSLYYYATSKQEILFHVINEGMKRLQNELDGIIEDMQGHHFESLLERAVNSHIKLTQSDEVGSLVLRTELRHLSGKYRKLVIERLEKYQQTWMSILKQGEQQGFLDLETSPKIYYLLIIAMCNNARQWYRSDGHLSTDQISQLITKLFIYGTVKSSLSKSEGLSEGRALSELAG